MKTFLRNSALVFGLNDPHQFVREGLRPDLHGDDVGPESVTSGRDFAQEDVLFHHVNLVGVVNLARVLVRHDEFCVAVLPVKRQR